jgi:hypothetical protein
VTLAAMLPSARRTRDTQEPVIHYFKRVFTPENIYLHPSCGTSKDMSAIVFAGLHLYCNVCHSNTVCVYLLLLCSLLCVFICN